MINEWLLQTSVDISLLIILVLLIKNSVRKVLGGHVAYWLWSIPLVYLVFPDFSIGQGTVLETIYSPINKVSSTVLAAPKMETISQWSWISTLWITGAIICLIIRTIAWIQFHRHLQNQAEHISLSPNLSFRVSQKTGDNLTKIQFFTVSKTQSPFVTGLFRPKIYLPHDFEHRFSLEQQVWVLAHEIKHIHRKDLWVQSGAEMLRAVFWFNPFVHWGVKAMRLDQEIACDHSVLKLSSKQERYQFGQALLLGTRECGVNVAIEKSSILSQPRLDFFTKTKERFVMLSKHKDSKVHSVLGALLCILIGVIAVTKAPTTLANSRFLTKDKITLNFQKIPLQKTIEIVAGFNNMPIFNTDIVNGNIVVNIHLEDVPADSVFKELLECGGLDFVEYESGIELRQSKELGRMPVNYCLINDKAHYLMEADEINFIDDEGNMLGKNAKTTKFR